MCFDWSRSVFSMCNETIQYNTIDKNKHKNDVCNMVGCFQVVKIYSFMKQIKVNIHTLYIVPSNTSKELLETKGLIGFHNKSVCK